MKTLSLFHGQISIPERAAGSNVDCDLGERAGCDECVSTRAFKMHRIFRAAPTKQARPGPQWGPRESSLILDIDRITRREEVAK